MEIFFLVAYQLEKKVLTQSFKTDCMID